MRTLIATLLALTLFSTPVAAQQKQKTDWGMGAAYVSLAAVTVADIDTTARALERGYVEQNPLLKPLTTKPGMVGLVNGAMTGGISLAAHHFLFKKGHKWQAKVVIWSWVAIRGAAAYHNAKALSK